MSGTTSRVVTYLPSLRTFLHRLRATSATPSSLTPTLLSSSPKTHITTSLLSEHPQYNIFDTDPLCRPPGIAKLGLQPGFTLPGAVGTVPNIKVEEEKFEKVLEEISNAESKTDVKRNVECKLQECPDFLHAEFMQLFPGVSVESGQLRVIILSEKTENDMTGWSPEVEEEREELLAHFVGSAKEICSRLTAAGYWADFIDPSSGRAFYGCYSHNTLFETDDKFRYLGFEILDLGCCKCITHPLWGSYTFVGTVFSNAPIMSSAIQEILNL